MLSQACGRRVQERLTSWRHRAAGCLSLAVCLLWPSTWCGGLGGGVCCSGRLVAQAARFSARCASGGPEVGGGIVAAVLAVGNQWDNVESQLSSPRCDSACLLAQKSGCASRRRGSAGRVALISPTGLSLHNPPSCSPGKPPK